MNSAHFDKILEEKTKECYHEIYDEHCCDDVSKAKKVCKQIITEVWKTDLSDEDKIIAIKNALRSIIHGIISTMYEEEIDKVETKMRQEMR